MESNFFRTVRDRRSTILLGVLASLVLYQIVVLSSSYIFSLSPKLWNIRDRPTWQRSAILLEGDRFAGHIGFMREQIPPDGRVILPPLSQYAAYEHIGFMQYFLFPRDIHNCGHAETPEECMQRMAGDSSYIVGLKYFPPRQPTLETKKFLEYQDDLGVFVPR